MTGLGMSIAMESMEEGLEKGREEGRQQIIHYMFDNGKTPKEVSDLIGQPAEYVYQLHEKYTQMLHEKGNYTTE